MILLLFVKIVNLWDQFTTNHWHRILFIIHRQSRTTFWGGTVSLFMPVRSNSRKWFH